MVKKNFLKSSLIVLAVLAVALIPTASVNASVANRDVPALAYSAHVQSFGWMGTKNASANVNDANTIAGTEGLSKRVEALRVTFEAPEGVVLKYNAHIQGIGWTGWTAITEANQLIGTEGQSKRLEAIKFSVTGLEGYEIKYRAHVQTYGWQDWLTADSSEGLARIAGTQGECKRIESLQFLILDSEAAEVFDLKQEAIQELKAFANPSEYTMNKKLLADALDDGIKLINEAANNKTAISTALNTAKENIELKNLTSDPKGVMNDRQIRDAVETLCGEIDGWLTSRSLDKPLEGETLKVTLTEVPSIKQAIADAKAEFLNKDSYEKDDFDKSDDSLYKEATDAIGIAIIEYAKAEIENLYNATYKPQDNVYTFEQHRDDLAILKLNEDGSVNEKDLPGLAEVLNLLKELAPVEGTTLQHKIEDYTGELNRKITGEYGDKHVIAQKGKLVAAGYLTVNYYTEISWVAEAIADGQEDMKNAKNIPQLIEIEENTLANALTGLKTFVNKIVADLDGLNNTGKVLTSQQIKTINTLMNKENLTASELITGYEEMVNALFN